MPPEAAQVQGNRLVLIGTVLYLLEWAAIIPVMLAGDFGPLEPGTRNPQEAAAIYAESAGRTALLAVWLSAVLLGRVMMVAGVRAAVRNAPSAHPLADAAVATMAVSVAIEVASFALVPGIGFAALQGADPATVAALDQVANLVWLMVFAPVAVSVLLTSLAMHASRFFPAWMSWLGMAAGSVAIAAAFLQVAAYGATGWVVTAANIASVSFPAALLWMISTGVFLFRRAGRSEAPSAVPTSTA